MAYFKDITRYDYSKYTFKCAGELYNVGWLERCAPYPKGDVTPELTAKLLALCKWPVNRYRGWHNCHFCQEYPVRITDCEGEICLGDGEIRVAATDGLLTYVAPNLIYHYVVEHHYLPPDGFLDALRNMSLPNPAVVWILEWIEEFQHQLIPVTHLATLLEWIVRRNRPSLPAEVRGEVVEAVNELKVANSTFGSDAQPTSENIVGRLKSVLTKS
ncbi:MAG: hypothetical protein JWQ87_5520 [Candidatus Sulfotelmatobacter sp.]|nr:hypothetical protein [Candidatus Sulfotelmatobacter sp.]